MVQVRLKEYLPCVLLLLLPLFFLLLCRVMAQPPPNLSPEEKAALIVKRQGIEDQLEAIAIIDRKVMMPMRDGERMAADIYLPKKR